MFGDRSNNFGALKTIAKRRYNDYGSVLKKLFTGRVQKISVNAGFTCPNRDGSKGVGGCTYCNNQSFSPDYCRSPKGIAEQVGEGIRFFKHKYTTQEYLVYFQSYTNTYGDLQYLRACYEEALEQDGVVGLVVGTRPDCVDEALLDYFAQLAGDKYVMIEYGVESVYDATLRFINRGHDFGEAEKAIRATAQRGIHTGAHFILGLPHETREMLLQAVGVINRLPIKALKLHQLQLIRGTAMEMQYAAHPEWFHFFEIEDYLELLVDFLERLNPQIAIERFVSQSPKDMLLKPDWGLKNFEFTAKLERRLLERNSWQGKLFEQG